MSNDVVVLSKETKAALVKRDLTEDQFRVLKDAIFPAAETIEAVMMAVDYCKARGLDIFKKPVHIVPVWSKAKGKMVETVWPGISEIRTTAARTGQYAGKSAPVWGPDIKTSLSNVDMIFPEWCEITVNKLVHGHVVPFTARVYWLETYATAKKDTQAPNAMWKKRPRGQLAKCAEAEALREAFPEEVGGEYAAEEMSGQALLLDAISGDAPAPPKREQFTTILYPLIGVGGEIKESVAANGFVSALFGAIKQTISEQGDVQELWDANYETLDQVRADNPGIDTAELNLLYNNWCAGQDADRGEALALFTTRSDNFIREFKACTSLGGLAESWQLHQQEMADMKVRFPGLYEDCERAKDEAKDALLEQHPGNA